MTGSGLMTGSGHMTGSGLMAGSLKNVITLENFAHDSIKFVSDSLKI